MDFPNAVQGIGIVQNKPIPTDNRGRTSTPLYLISPEQPKGSDVPGFGCFLFYRVSFHLFFGKRKGGAKRNRDAFGVR
jgi:hypothetical protein